MFSVKRKRKSFFVFIFLIVLGPSFLLFKNVKAESLIRITKVQFSGGSGKADEDYIEITNFSQSDFNLKGYRLVKRTQSATQDTTIKSWTKDEIIPRDEKHIWANSKNGFAESIGSNSSTTQTISETNGIALRLGKEDEGEIIDSVNWKNDPVEDDDEAVEEKKDDEEKNKKDAKKYIGKVKISEIYPSPSLKNCTEGLSKKISKEFVEIVNLTKEEIDFSSWYIKDENEYKKEKVGGGKKLKGGEKSGRFYLKEDNFAFNSSGDSVYLYDENDNLIDVVRYTFAKYCYSYAFSGSDWHWTSQITPNSENIFDIKLSGKVKKDSKIYKGVYANFESDSGKKVKKFVWDFGDGHKSYLKKTKHKYEKTGKYLASLKLSGEGEDATYEFIVNVEKYEAPEIRIKSFVPNPKGSDENEYIVIKNNSKKKINLKGWSIATGWDKLINHLIREDFEIKAGKEKKLKKEICAFTLNNVRNKIELRSPDGKSVQKIKYNRKENKIEEDEMYQEKNDQWDWISADNDIVQEEIENALVKKVVELATDKIAEKEKSLSFVKKEDFSENDKLVAIVDFDLKLKMPAKAILKKEKSLKENDSLRGDFYFFTKAHPKKHWIENVRANVLVEVNSRLNGIISKFSLES